MGETSIANKAKLGRVAALVLARESDEVIAMRGKKVIRLRIADRPSDDELAAVILGPTGNLRAPAIRMGRMLVIGFHLEVFAELFG